MRLAPPPRDEGLATASPAAGPACASAPGFAPRAGGAMGPGAEAGAETGAGAEIESARLRATAGAMDWVMRFPLAAAPGLVFVGARSTPAKLVADAPADLHGSHAGGAESQAAAFAACLGEAAEFLSQFERPGDLLPPGHGLEEAEEDLGWTPPTTDRVRALRLHDGAAVAAPADRCLRRPGIAAAAPPPMRLGLGCAAGRTIEEARLRAVLELVERDAAALWWRGGRAARPLDAAAPGLDAAFAAVARWRGGLARRTMVFGDLTTELGVPVVAAWAMDVEAGPAGRALTVGVAARMSTAEALLSAAREAIQGELALSLLADRLAHSGEGVATAGDRALLARAAIDPARDPRLALRGVPRRAGEDEAAEAALPAPVALARLAARLAGAGHPPACVDLTRDIPGLPVAWAMAPGLQPDPCELAVPRLVAARREAAAGFPWGSPPAYPPLW